MILFEVTAVLIHSSNRDDWSADYYSHRLERQATVVGWLTWQIWKEGCELAF